MIADFTVTYKYVNRDQIIQFIDTLTYNSSIGDMAVGKFSVNSTSGKVFVLMYHSFSMESMLLS